VTLLRILHLLTVLLALRRRNLYNTFKHAGPIAILSLTLTG
jgi:hypothetical protein